MLPHPIKKKGCFFLILESKLDNHGLQVATTVGMLATACSSKFLKQRKTDKKMVIGKRSCRFFWEKRPKFLVAVRFREGTFYVDY